MSKHLHQSSAGSKTIGIMGIAAVLAAVALAASSASAGTYVINDCPSAPAPNGSAGPWQVFGAPETSKASCAGGYGDFIGPLGGTMSSPSSAGVAVYAPAGITIADVSVYWFQPQSISGSHTYAQAWSGGTLMGEAFGGEVDHEYTPDNYTLPAGASSFLLESNCTTDDYSAACKISEAGQAPDLQMWGSAITLSDGTPPTGNVTGGTLAGSGPFAGTHSLAFKASDPATGVRSVQLLLDGKVVAQKDYLAQCPYANFLACPPNLTGTISWETGSVAAGSYELALQVTDAAGNTTILDRHGIGTDGPSSNPNASTGPSIGPGSPTALRGPANGTNASDQAKLSAHWAGTSKALHISRYGAVDRVTGRLETSTGQPISGATLDVYEVPAYDGAKPVQLTGTRTGGTGTWSLTLPRDISSSAVRIAYRSHLNDTVPAATATLTLRVHAGVALKITPRISSVGHSIHFSGTLHGTPIPEGGKQLVLEARSGRGEWIQFDTIRTNAKGRYRASYRFKFPGPITYRFRVLSRFEAGFPFLDGTSNVVGVYER